MFPEMSKTANEECSNLLAVQDADFMKNWSTYSVDNESGYEDTISEANDTLNDSIEQENTETVCCDSSSTSHKNIKRLLKEDESFDITNDDKGEDGRDSADTLADDMSLLSLDHLSQMESHTR